MKKQKPELTLISKDARPTLEPRICSAGVPPATGTSDEMRASCLPQSERDPIAARTSCPQHKHWHSRGYLPHCDTPGLHQAITFRLADSLPADVLGRLQEQASNGMDQHKKIEAFLDAGFGACWLKQPAIADLVEDALLHWDGQRYCLLAWCVMPNHVHVLIETRDGWPLSGVLHSWKSFTAKAINQHLGRTGTVWMRDYFDRYIRDDYHLAAVINYIHGNPVKAGLVQKEWEWPYSSVRMDKESGHPARINDKQEGERDARVPRKP